MRKKMMERAGATAVDRQVVRMPASEDRREWIRIEDKLLLEYRLEGGHDKTPASGRETVTDEMIAAAVEKPTTELLARSGDVLAQAALVPWIMKVDWLLEVILKTLAKSSPGCMELATVTDVNIANDRLVRICALQARHIHASGEIHLLEAVHPCHLQEGVQHRPQVAI